jgi:predicted CoA-binding protein
MMARLIDGHREIDALLSGLRRIAALGIKPETHAAQPAHMVPAYMQRHGYEVIPVPVYYPDVTQILGMPVHRRLQDVPGRIDLVDVFRKPQDLMPHLDDILAAKPRTVWLQSGIRHDDFARALTRAGIDVVQDQCLMVEHRRWKAGH